MSTCNAFFAKNRLRDVLDFDTFRGFRRPPALENADLAGAAVGRGGGIRSSTISCLHDCLLRVIIVGELGTIHRGRLRLERREHIWAP